MTTLLYGRPPVVFDPPGDATQTSPLIPDAAALEIQPVGSADSIMKNEAVIEAYLGTGLKNKVAAEIAEESAFHESHGAQPGLGAEAGQGGDGKPAGDL